MPRDLADVLHYFLPELDNEGPARPEPPHVGGAGRACSDSTSIDPVDEAAARAPAAAIPALPILGLPIGDEDVVRAALAWNLAVETSRLGGSSVLLAPDSDRDSSLWPEAGIGPLGCELLFCPAKDLGSLYATACQLATARAENARRGGVVFVRIPPKWFETDAVPRDMVRWMLLMSSPNRRDLNEALELAATVTRTHSNVEVGLTVLGVQSVSQARIAFESLAQRTREKLGLDLISYGLLVDDLNVYRAIAAQRPIGLAHPQAPATRALMDVARLLYEDARSRVLG